MDKEAEAQFAHPCPDCQGGVRHLQYLTYFTWLGDELITVPNFPAWVCDVCGRREYDMRAISWLTMMLNSPRSRPSHTRPHTPASKSGAV